WPFRQKFGTIRGRFVKLPGKKRMRRSLRAAWSQGRDLIGQFATPNSPPRRVEPGSKEKARLPGALQAGLHLCGREDRIWLYTLKKSGTTLLTNYLAKMVQDDQTSPLQRLGLFHSLENKLQGDRISKV